MLDDDFEKITNSSFKTYGLYSSHYMSAQALCWDAVLNMTNVGLEFISDADMILFLKKVWEVEFLPFLRDQVNPTVSI